MKNNDAVSVLPETTQVLVIGYGPVGAALAVMLGRYGVRALIVDKAMDIALMPRAIALDNEALRILQMMGLAEDAFERVVIPKVKMHCPYVGQFGEVNTKGSIDGHPKLVTFYQPDLEHALRQEIAQFSSITVSTGLELVDLIQIENGVTALLKDKTGTVHKVIARYLIGADGASSTVRSLIGLDFQGKTYVEDWLIVDVCQRHGKAIDHVEFVCDPKRPTPHMPAPGGRERWEFMLRPGETREEMEHPEKVVELLSPWIRSSEVRIERKAVYRFHARCCDRFRVGHVFLVGDAAHITPPFVGQGLVAGLRDVANLGWKLVWSLKGDADEMLLDSYDQERRPHAHKMIELAKFMGHLVMPHNLTKAVITHGLMQAARFLPPLRRQLEELKIKPANRFTKGFFIPGRSGAKLIRGAQLPQVWLRFGGHICLSDDVLGDQMTLIGIGISPETLLDAKTQQRWMAGHGRLLHIGRYGEIPEPATTNYAQALNGSLVENVANGWIVVVRPDRVIMDDGPVEAAQQIVDRCMRMFNN